MKVFNRTRTLSTVLGAIGVFLGTVMLAMGLGSPGFADAETGTGASSSASASASASTSSTPSQTPSATPSTTPPTTAPTTPATTTPASTPSTPVPTTTVSATPALPVTGSKTSWFIGTGLALLAAGAAAILWSRRRRDVQFKV